MDLTLRLWLLAGVIVYFAVILVALRKKSLTLKYSLLWMFSAFLLLITVIFPQVIDGVTKLLGIASPVNAVFTIILFLVLMILISLSVIVSKQHAQIKKLIQSVALLEKRLRDGEVPQGDELNDRG